MCEICNGRMIPQHDQYGQYLSCFSCGRVVYGPTHDSPRQAGLTARTTNKSRNYITSEGNLSDDISRIREA